MMCELARDWNYAAAVISSESAFILRARCARKFSSAIVRLDSAAASFAVAVERLLRSRAGVGAARMQGNRLESAFTSLSTKRFS